MKFTLSWLKAHLDTDAPLSKIAETLTMLGLEVEAIDDPSEKLTGFTIAEIVEANPHPNADRLRVCSVNTGSSTIQVVCGAPNARAGLRVILAQPGTFIPATGDLLKKGVVRGVESQGMMCSWRELALGEDHDGIAELSEDYKIGDRLLDHLAVDPVIEISLTPNRADCLGVRGIASDLAAAGLGTLKPLAEVAVKSTFPSSIGVSLDFTPETADSCSLFAGRLIRDVKNGESPQWLKDRLTAIGLRPISALVDITNFFTFDQARPLHVFDADKIQGNLTVRLAREGESLLALNGKSYSLPSSVVVIADESGALSIGGVMGGESSGTSEATVNVFLESAYFSPQRIADAGRALTVESDARHRFERFVDPALTIPAIEQATALILELCGGEASEPVIAGAEPTWQRTIHFRPERVQRLSGLSLSLEEITGKLVAVGCQVVALGDKLEVAPPSWRADIAEEHDLVEEVIRLHGYDNLPLIPLPRAPLPRTILTPQQRRTQWVKRQLAARGLTEAVTWSFLPSAQAKLFGGGKPELVLANPISSDLDSMRPSVLPNLITAAGRNADRGFKDVALFEIGPQFAGDRPQDQKSVTAGIRVGKTGPRHWASAARPVDALDAKADILAALGAAGLPADAVQISRDAPSWYHPGRSGSLKQGPKLVGWFGEIHPSVLSALDVKGPVVGFELFLGDLPLPKARPTKAKSALKLSPFQPLERDFAFVLDRAVDADKILRAVKTAAKGSELATITDSSVFDVYEGEHAGEGRKSVAVSVSFQPTSRTLTDVEIEGLCQKLVEAVVKATGAVLRG